VQHQVFGLLLLVLLWMVTKHEKHVRLAQGPEGQLLQ
jgi:hypothetical protein